MLSPSLSCSIVWHNLENSFLWVWVSASQRIPSSVLVRNPHKWLSREISYETWRRQGKARSQGSQQKRAVNRSWGKVTVRERQLLSKELGPEEPETGSVSVRGRVSVPGSCVGTLEYTLVTDTEAQNARKVPKTSSFLRLELIQVCASLFFFFLPSRMCMLRLECL